MRRSGIIKFIAACALAHCLPWAAAQNDDGPPIQWLTSEAVRRQLDQPVSIRWSGVPLRQALSNLARLQRVAIVLDRRVDPDQEIELTQSDVSLEAALKSIALRLNLGVGRAGPVLYLGPPKTAERLWTLVEVRKQEIAKLAPAVRSTLLALKRCRWEQLSTPREILTQAARDYRVQIEPLGNVPHDLWPAADLPAIGLAERVSLVAAQFDLTFELAGDGRTLRLVPMPETLTLEKSYSYANPPLAIQRLKSVLKQSQLEAGVQKFIVRGPAEEHELVEALVAGKTVKQTTVTAGKKIYQLNIAMPVGRLIKELGAKLELEVAVDEDAIAAAGLNLDKEVKVSVKEATEEELLRAVLEPAGLTFERVEKKLLVRPKQPNDEVRHGESAEGTTRMTNQ
jgi:hypothetical protein